MKHVQEHDELVAAGALHALNVEQEMQLQTLLSSCENCREEYVEMQNTAAQLAFLSPSEAPSSDLKRRILAGVLEESKVGGSAETLTDLQNIQQPRRGRKLVGLALAGVLLFAGVGVSTSLQNTQSQESQVVALAETAADPSTQRVILNDVISGDAQATVFFNKGEVLMTSDALPESAPEEQYVLWVENTKGELRAVDGFTVSGEQEQPAVRANINGSVTAFAISKEVAGELPASPSYAVASGAI